MSGETDLSKLLGSMSPSLSGDEFVYCALPPAEAASAAADAWAVIKEDEAVTVVIEKRSADERGYAYESTFGRITLTVHSSLEAVGLTAAVATRLAESGISANVVAAYYHDHVFVQKTRAVEALRCLEELAREHAARGGPPCL